jgi:hypothetical protein
VILLEAGYINKFMVTEVTNQLNGAIVEKLTIDQLVKKSDDF